MIKRQLIASALNTCQKLKSEETAFLHCRPNRTTSCHSIPVYENLLFVLLLFQSRTLANIQEAKSLLEKLLCYQTSKGFPVYLHEYPECFSRLQTVTLLAPFFWLLHDFTLYLEKPLLKKLQITLKKLISSSLHLLDASAHDYLTNLRIFSAAFAIGELFNSASLIKRGREGLSDLLALGSQPIWFSRKGIASVLCSLQMACKSISKSSWSQFWLHVQRSWHPHYHEYTGPFFDEDWTKPCLYDLMLAAYFKNTLPGKLLFSDIYHLETALIHPGEECNVKSDQNTSSLQTFGKTKWVTRSNSSYFYSVITGEKKGETQKHFYPFNLHMQTLALVCTKGHITNFIDEGRQGECISLFFSLSEDPVQDPFKKAYEIIFCSQSEEKILIEGFKATTFQLNETLIIGPLKMQFLLHQGNGDFVGAIKPMAIGGGWEIILRAVRKKSPCIISVKVKPALKA